MSARWTSQTSHADGGRASGRIAAPAVLVLSLLIAHSLVAAEPDAGDQAERFFVENIQPLLATHCYACHSHEGEIEGGLTLDSGSGWKQGGARGPAILPGEPERSLVIKAIRHADPKLRMPPDDKLTDEEIALIVRWVETGARDPRTTPTQKQIADPLDWWSLRPLQQASAQTNIVESNPIDGFVRDRLYSEGLQLAAPAERRNLIRRLYFDLHGLPPTPQDVAAFVADPDDLAYEKMVDRLLDSPRYGERWARHWLDTVHFADSHGCEHDNFRPNAWPYRDYVIESLNRDTPWDRFIREQLAADYYFPDEPRLTAALGFIGAGPIELSRASTAPVTFDYLDRDDMVTQTMAAFTSTTANCARCHDHKFDPITQEDYYSLQAVFAGIGKGDVEFDADPTVARQRKHYNEVLAASETHDQTILLSPEFESVVQAWEREFGSKSSWEPLSPSIFVSSDGATLTRLEDDSLIASGTRPDKDTYTITTPLSLSRLTAIRLDAIADDRLPMKGPGRCDNGNLHLTEFEALVFDADAAEPTRLKFSEASSDWNQQGWTISHSLDENLATAWGIYPKVGASHHAAFQLETPVDLKPSSQLVVVLKQLHGGGHLIGRLKLYATDAPNAAASLLPDSVRAAIKIPRDQRSESQQLAIVAHALQRYAREKLDALPAREMVFAVSHHYSHGKKHDVPLEPKVVHVLRRGDIHQPGEVALPGALGAMQSLGLQFKLDDPKDERQRRAALADWLASADNPLTWRSIVNRVWHYHFGRGLCDTPNDFGRMGGLPSHPELLDWLAVWFRDQAGGSLKQLHRLILTSETYRQLTSNIDRNGIGVDAENRLLWRMNRQRLDAEAFRDAVLQISGRIDLTMGGPGIQQFSQSKGQQTTPVLDYKAFDWNSPAAARRSIYRVVWRGIADPFMESLDFPDLGLLSPKRSVSLSAMQALPIFNNDFVLYHSQHLANRLTNQHAEVDDQIAEACRLIWLREPSAEEHKRLREYANEHGMAATCRVLFNSNEFLFVE